MDQTTELPAAKKLIVTKEEDSKNINNLHANVTKKLKGIMAAFGCVVLAVTSTTCAQLLKRKVPDFELNTLRIGVPFVAFSFALLVTRTIPVLPREEYHCLRNIQFFKFYLLFRCNNFCAYLNCSVFAFYMWNYIRNVFI